MQAGRPGVRKANRIAARAEDEPELVHLDGSELVSLPLELQRNSLVQLTLTNSPLASCEGIQSCSQLWWLDVSRCELSTVAPIARLVALGQLNLRDNRLSMPAALELRRMSIGRLALEGNPLLPEGLRAALGMSTIESEALVARSFLVEMLPCVVCLDGAFISSSERTHCRAFFEDSDAGQQARVLMLQEATPAPPPSLAALNRLSRTSRRVEALTACMAGWDALHSAGTDVGERSQGDSRRLKWLATDFDDREALAARARRVAPRPPAPATTAAAAAAAAAAGAADIDADTKADSAATADASEAAGAGAPEAAGGSTAGGAAPALSLSQLVSRPWLSGTRRLNLMALLAVSLHQSLPGKLVLEALQRLCGSDVRAEHVTALSRLPPCMRASLLMLLAKRGHDGVSSGPLWRYISYACIFGTRSAAEPPPAPGERQPAPMVDFSTGESECSALAHRLLSEMPSWGVYAPPDEPSVETTPRLASLPEAPLSPVPRVPTRGAESAIAAAAAAEYLSCSGATIHSPVRVRSPDRPFSAGRPHSAGLSQSRTTESLLPPGRRVPSAARERPSSRERLLGSRPHTASDCSWDTTATPDALAGRAPPESGMAGVMADNLSWGASFMIASAAAQRGGMPGRTGAAARRQPAAPRPQGWAPLAAPAYLLKRHDQTFLHVEHPEPPAPERHPRRPKSGGSGGRPGEPLAAGPPEEGAAQLPSGATTPGGSAPHLGLEALRSASGPRGGDWQGDELGGQSRTSSRPSVADSKLMMAAPRVTGAGFMSAQEYKSIHEQQRTWFAVPGQQGFLLQPTGAAVRPGASRSKLRASVEDSKRRVDAVGAAVRRETQHNLRKHTLIRDPSWVRAPANPQPSHDLSRSGSGVSDRVRGGTLDRSMSEPLLRQSHAIAAAKARAATAVAAAAASAAAARSSTTQPRQQRTVRAGRQPQRRLPTQPGALTAPPKPHAASAAAGGAPSALPEHVRPTDVRGWTPPADHTGPVATREESGRRAGRCLKDLEGERSVYEGDFAPGAA